jgi:hypothetical protein
LYCISKVLLIENYSSSILGWSLKHEQTLMMSIRQKKLAPSASPLPEDLQNSLISSLVGDSKSPILFIGEISMTEFSLIWLRRMTILNVDTLFTRYRTNICTSNMFTVLSFTFWNAEAFVSLSSKLINQFLGWVVITIFAIDL